MMQAKIENRKFLIDGKESRILSGEIHYFRVPREYWRDRLKKLKACGLNTVATYIPWNLHERSKGTFDFSGDLDLCAFLETADELGLKVILRPGPYICAEWEFGGFPAWLLAEPGLRLRCSEPKYLAYVKRYLEAVYDKVRKFYTRNIILLQIENGYASYGNDMVYYEFLKKLADESGYQNVLIAADGDSDIRLTTDVPEGVWRTLMCGFSDPVPQLELYRKRQPDYPQLIIEYWDGWFAATGETFKMRDQQGIVDHLAKALEYGAHVNLYMFHGGTNFGFMNGAIRGRNYYQQMTTSYDYAAPLTESGDVTELYRKFRELFAKYNPEFSAETPIPPDPPKASYGEVRLDEFAELSENLDALSVHPQTSVYPLTMEEAGGDYGFMRYSTQLPAQSIPIPVTITSFQDRGFAYFNGKYLGAFNQQEAFTLPADQSGRLDIIVENMGRTDFRCNLEDNRKGISGGVILNHQRFHFNWLSAPLPMEDLSQIKYGKLPEFPVKKRPGFFRGRFHVETPMDTFLMIPGGSYGFCRINGRLLGRYNKSGPYYSLYVPAPFLKKGENTVDVFEQDYLARPMVRFADHPNPDMKSFSTLE